MSDAEVLPAPGHRLYFAYGVNMHRGEMRRRCPRARFLGRARLEGFRFLITRKQVATVLPAPGLDTWGALWEIDPRCERRLDHFESIHRLQYRRAEVVARSEDGRPARCLIYLCRDTRPGRPYAGYMERILEARRDLGL